MWGFLEKKPVSDPSVLTYLDVDDNLETNIPGLYVAGDLSGIPLMKNAINQGHDVVERIAGEAKGGEGGGNGALDLLIVGAGAAGLSAALRAKERGLNCRLIEQGKMANTLTNFPAAKLLFAEPEGMQVKGRLWFEESETGDLLERWKKDLENADLNVNYGEKVLDVQKKEGRFEVKTDKAEYKARRVLLAMGKQGNPRRLGVPGEDLPKFSNRLYSPEKYRDSDIAVIGAGDSAAEAALMLCDANRVTMIVRGPELTRPKARNIEALKKKVSEQKLKILFETSVKEIRVDAIVLVGRQNGEIAIPNDFVFATLGAEPPYGFLKKIGVNLLGSWTAKRVVFFFAFFGVILLYYLSKGYKSMDGFSNFLVERYGLFDIFPPAAVAPFEKLGHLLPKWWGAAVYTGFVAVAGLYYVFKRQPRHYQNHAYLRWRNLSVIFFQGFFFFLLPEIIAKDGNYYALMYVWPLTLFGPAGKWSALLQGQGEAWFWGGWTLFMAFVAMPVFVYFHGKRYCSWVCGCGALAETAGEPFRHLAPKGLLNRRRERAIYAVLVWAVLMTCAVVAKPYIASDIEPMRYAYWFLIVFAFSGVVGVGLYPFFGNRIWCRYGCPLAAYMNLLGAIKSRFKIVSNDKCIDCGQCNRYCEMGIDVKGHALKQKPITLRETPCIGCGECTAVCPMNVLSFGGKAE